MLQLCRIIFYISAVFLAIKGKEVAVQDDADAFQQARINSFAPENVIHIGAVAVQLLCEPSGAAFLALQLRFYFFTEVYGHCFVAAPMAASLLES